MARGVSNASRIVEPFVCAFECSFTDLVLLFIENLLRGYKQIVCCSFFAYRQAVLQRLAFIQSPYRLSLISFSLIISYRYSQDIFFLARLIKQQNSLFPLPYFFFFFEQKFLASCTHLVADTKNLSQSLLLLNRCLSKSCDAVINSAYKRASSLELKILSRYSQTFSRS